MTTCVLCGKPFTPVALHPAVTGACCPGCWATIRERLEVVGLLPVSRLAIPALRAEEV